MRQCRNQRSAMNYEVILIFCAAWKHIVLTSILIAASRSKWKFNLFRCRTLIVRGNRGSSIKFGVRLISQHLAEITVLSQHARSFAMTGTLRREATGILRHDATAILHGAMGFIRYVATGILRHDATQMLRQNATGFLRHDATGSNAFLRHGATGILRHSLRDGVWPPWCNGGSSP